MFNNKYRIVKDSYSGYEAQVKMWWLPIWIQIGGINTSSTIEGAKVYIELHKNRGHVVHEE